MAMRDMTSSEAGDVAGAAEADPRERIAKLEAKIEALAQSAERCRKISLAARAAIVLGAVGFAAMALGAWRFGGAPLIFSTAAILGGVVLFGAWPSPLLTGAQNASLPFMTARQLMTTAATPVAPAP